MKGLRKCTKTNYRPYITNLFVLRKLSTCFLEFECVSTWPKHAVQANAEPEDSDFLTRTNQARIQDACAKYRNYHIVRSLIYFLNPDRQADRMSAESGLVNAQRRFPPHPNLARELSCRRERILVSRLGLTVLLSRTVSLRAIHAIQ